MNLNDDLLNQIIKHANGNIYLVGGAVRDLCMGKSSCDRDIIIEGEDARDFALSVADTMQAAFVPLDEENKIYRIVMPNKIDYLDITNPIENSLEKDLLRRDLTMNAVAINLKTNQIIDICGGLEDIKNRKIKMISEKNIIDDPLRILRAYRFQAVLGFEIEEQTNKAIKKHYNKIHACAVERINCELIKLFGGAHAHQTLLDMGMLLDEIFPITVDLKKVPANSHHHLDLYHHSIETVKQIQDIYEKGSDEVKLHLETIDFGGESRLAHLKLAGFLHDIGKFSTWAIIDDKHRFIKHDDVGAKISVDILRKMNFSKKQIDYISTMIKYHIYPANVVCAPILSEKIYMRYIRKMENNSIDAIILSMADRLSARGPEITQEIVDKNINGLTQLLNFYLEVKDGLEPLPKLLSGNDIMKILKIKPSPYLGEVVDALREAQINGDVTTRQEAEEFVKELHG